MNNQNYPNKQKKSNYIGGIVFIIILYVLLVSAVLIWIPRSNIPTIILKSSPDGTIMKGNLWEFYKSKSKPDIKKILPTSFDTGDFMVADQYADDSKTVLLEVFYNDDDFEAISLVLETSGDVCGTTNEKDMDTISDFASWSLERLGLSVTNMERKNTDSFTVFTNSEGVQCGISNCPKDNLAMFACSYDDSYSEISGHSTNSSDYNNSQSQNQLSGSLHSGYLWKHYYGKTIAEVREDAPMFVSIGDDIYKLDIGYMDEDTKEYPTTLYGTFENGRLIGLGLGSSEMGNLCAIPGKNQLNQNHFELINTYAFWCMDLLGLVTSEDWTTGRFSIDEKHIYLADDNTSIIYITPSGVLCTIDSCPGTDMVFSCLKPYN